MKMSGCGLLSRSIQLLLVVGLFMMRGASMNAVDDRAVASQSDESRFALAETWDVPSQEPELPNRPVHLHAAAEQGELFALEQGGTRVAAVTPSGSVLRRFGAGELISGTASALVYPPTPSGQTPLDAVASRLMVTDPSAGDLVLFDLAGQLAGRSSTFQRPIDIAFLRSDESTFQAAVLDVGSSSVAFVDLAGRIQRSIDLESVEPPIVNATAIVADDNWRPAEMLSVGVLDQGRNELVWLRVDGSRAAASDLSIIASTGAGLEGARIMPYPYYGGHRALVATSSGLWLADASSFRRWATDLPIIDSLDVMAHGAVDAVAIGDVDRLPTYQKGHLYVMRQGSRTLTQVFLGEPPGGELEVRPGCRPAAALRNEPWRIGVSDDGTPWVTSANGIVQPVGPGSDGSETFSLGLVDDVEVSGDVVYAAREQASPIFQRTDFGVLTIERDSTSRTTQPWFEAVDCMESGFGVRSSIGVDTSDLTTTLGAMLVYDSGSRDVSFRQWSRKVLNGDRTAGVPALRKDWRAGLQTPPAPRYMSDVATSDGGEVSAAIERLEGAVYIFDIEKQTTSKWSVPGRPHRLHWSQNGHLFVLTAEGFVFEFAPDGSILGGWDAAGAAPNARADLVDIAVDRKGRPLLLARSGSVLVFDRVENGATQAPPVELPPPCTVSTHASAFPSRVARGASITVTLSVDGSCLRAAAENDILVVLQPRPGAWGPQIVDAALNDFVGLLDPSKDRLGLMVFDTTAELVVPFTDGYQDVKNAAADVMVRSGDYLGIQQPLDVARAYMSTSARQDVNRVVLAVTDGLYDRENSMYGMVRAADALRRDGVRVIVISDRSRYSRIPSMLAFMPEDFYIAPDEATLRAVYQQLGRAFGARYLTRDSRLIEVPETALAYELDSASPSADWDSTARSLTWHRPTIAFGGWETSYRVQATETGRLAVSQGAILEFVDGFGHEGRASFPIPWVEVFEPPTPTPTPVPSSTIEPTQVPVATVQSIYLPLALKETCEPDQRGVDLVILMDASGSMFDLTRAGRTKIEAAREAAGALLDRLHLGDGDRASIVQFHSSARRLSGLIGDRTTLDVALSFVTTGAGTRIDLGLAEARAILDAASSGSRGPRSRVIVLMTDGRTENPPEALREADAATSGGQVIFAIGLGEGVDIGFLEQISGSSSRVFIAPDAEDLAEVYARVGGEIPCPAGQYWGRR